MRLLGKFLRSATPVIACILTDPRPACASHPSDQNVAGRRMDQIGNEAAQHIWRKPAADMCANCDQVGLRGDQACHGFDPSATDDFYCRQGWHRIKRGNPGIALLRRLVAQCAGHRTARTIARQAGKRDWHRVEGSQLRPGCNGCGHPQSGSATRRKTDRNQHPCVVMIGRVVHQQDRPQRSTPSWFRG